MPFVSMLNTVQAELVYTWNSQTCENVLQFEAAGAISVPNMLELGAHLVSWYNTSMKALQSTFCTLTTIRLTDMTAEFAPGLDYTVGLPIIGTLGTDSMPNNVSISLTKRTIFRGRSYRGRIYQVGMGESQVQGNIVVATPLTNMITAWELLLAFSTTSEAWNMVVASKYEDGNERGTALLTPVINITSDGIIDSQRRRLPGRGN